MPVEKIQFVHEEDKSKLTSIFYSITAKKAKKL